MKRGDKYKLKQRIDLIHNANSVLTVLYVNDILKEVIVLGEYGKEALPKYLFTDKLMKRVA